MQTAPSIPSTFRQKFFPVVSGRILPAMALLLIMVLYSRKLSYDAYGQYQAMWLYNSIIGAVTSFGISSVMLSTPTNIWVQFIQCNRQTIMGWYTLLSLVCFVVFFFTDTYFDPTQKLLLLLLFLVQNAAAFTDSLLVKKQEISLYVTINSTYTFLLVLLHAYYYYFSFNLDGLIIGLIAVSLVKPAGLFWAGTTTFAKVQDETPLEQVGHNWRYIGLNEITGVLARWLDKIFLLYLLSPAAFAVFFNGAFEIPLFAILITAVENIALSQISQHPHDRPFAAQIFKDGFKILSTIAFPIFAFLLCMHQELFAWAFNNKYNQSLPVFVIAIWIIPIRINHYGILLQSYGKANLLVAGSYLDIVLSFLLMLLLYRWMGTPGVALALVIATWVQAIFYTWQSASVLQTTISQLVPFAYLAKMILLLLTAFGGFFFMKQYLSLTMSLCLSTLLLAMICGTGLWLLLRTKRIHPIA